MVLLTVTPAAKAAIDAYLEVETGEADNDKTAKQREQLSQAEVGSPIEHHQLVSISRHLVQHSGGSARQWRLDTLLKGATVYQAPPPPKPEPVRFFPLHQGMMHR